MKVILSSLLDRIVAQGTLSVTWPDRSVSVFAGASGPSASIAFRDRAVVRRVALDPMLAFGEAYMDGALEPVDCDIYDVLDLLMLNLQGGVRHPVLRWHQRLRRLARPVTEANGKRASRRNVAHHYDLDDRLYARMLDADRQYSCAYFTHPGQSLEDAQAAKKHLIASKLFLDRPDLRVLDIGCGWGGLALTLARDYGASVTGITLSREQRAVAERRAEEAGLGDRVRFLLADYRDVTGRFDRVVSVGMMEHVGVRNFAPYFRSVHDRLEDDGVALIHHIARTDGPGATSPWLRKWIFPGGYAPALSETLPAIEASGLIISDLETLRLHYAETLRAWRSRFAAARDELRVLYDERFCRMFEFYLAGAELAFRREREVVYQLQLVREQEALPFTRDYMLGPRATRSARAFELA